MAICQTAPRNVNLTAEVGHPLKLCYFWWQSNIPVSSHGGPSLKTCKSWRYFGTGGHQGAWGLLKVNETEYTSHYPVCSGKIYLPISKRPRYKGREEDISLRQGLWFIRDAFWQSASKIVKIPRVKQDTGKYMQITVGRWFRWFVCQSRRYFSWADDEEWCIRREILHSIFPFLSDT